MGWRINTDLGSLSGWVQHLERKIPGYCVTPIWLVSRDATEPSPRSENPQTSGLDVDTQLVQVWGIVLGLCVLVYAHAAP